MRLEQLIVPGIVIARRPFLLQYRVVSYDLEKDIVTAVRLTDGRQAKFGAAEVVLCNPPKEEMPRHDPPV